MALPPIIKTRDTVPLISPLDSAIDAEATSAEFLAEYSAGTEHEALDITRLSLVDGSEPTLFHVRGLSSRERDIALSLTVRALHSTEYTDTDHPDGGTPEERMMATSAYLGYCLRFGLAKVENYPGWAFKKETSYGMKIWPEAILDAIDPHTFSWLAIAVSTLSTVPLARSEPSGS